MVKHMSPIISHSWTILSRLIGEKDRLDNGRPPIGQVVDELTVQLGDLLATQAQSKRTLLEKDTTLQGRCAFRCQWINRGLQQDCSCARYGFMGKREVWIEARRVKFLRHQSRLSNGMLVASCVGKHRSASGSFERQLWILYNR